MTAILSPIRARIQSIFRFMGMDHASVFGMVQQVWGPLAGLMTLALITRFFSPEIQGLHYTFLTLASLQIILELGLAQVILQFASHEWAKLDFSEGAFSGDPQALSRLASLRTQVTKWYGMASVLCFTSLQGAGLYLFRNNGVTHGWFLPWTLVCLAITGDLLILPYLALLDGCNQIRSTQFMRLLRAMTNSFALWAAMALGAGLWSAGISLWAGLVAMFLLGAGRHGKFFRRLAETPIQARLDWMREVWPMQWRSGLSWLSGYFSFYMFVPVLFKFHGALAAGQLGMTLSLLAPLSALSSTLVLTKAPAFGQLVAQRQWQTLDRLTLRVGLGAIGLYGLGALCLLGIVEGLRMIGMPLVFRLLPPADMALFLLAGFGMQVTVPMSSYLRAHKREPLATLSVLSGVLIGLGVIVMGRAYGALGMGLAYSAVSILFVVPYATILFLRLRKAWHLPGAAG